MKLHTTATLAAIWFGCCAFQNVVVLAEERVRTPDESDRGIRLLLAKIDTTIALYNPAPLNELTQYLTQADSLAATASPEGRRMLSGFPAALRQHGTEAQTKGEDVKSINFTVFADYAEQVIEKTLKQPEARPAAVKEPPPPIKEASPPPPPIKEASVPSPVPIQTAIATSPRPPTPPPPDPRPPPPSAEQVLVERGDEMLRIGQVSAARMLYQRAAESGLALAALKLGDTYDGEFLERRKLLGIKPEPELAAKWYRKAQDMGDLRARDRLQVLQKDNKLANLRD